METCCKDIKTSCKNGHLNCLKNFHQNGTELECRLIYDCIDENKNEGHFECIKYIHRSIDQTIFYVPWEVSLSVGGHGYLDIIKYLEFIPGKIIDTF